MKSTNELDAKGYWKAISYPYHYLLPADD